MTTLESTQTSSMTRQKDKAVGKWLMIGVVMVVIQIMLGGITRLTGSGLSITEWNPLFGFIPPITADQWQASFAEYQKIGQFQQLNSHFTLEEYKSIFFWEWFHRVWARLLGFVFAIGFVYFLVKKYFRREMVLPLINLFILGAAQGLVGWIMVMSGLNDTDLYVNHIKLMFHFIAAMILLLYTLWFALKLLVPSSENINQPSYRRIAMITLILLFVQMSYGAFMAGLKAATAASTWPSINGDYIIPRLFERSWLHDTIAIHFIHRNLGYLIAIVITIISIQLCQTLKRAEWTGLAKKMVNWPIYLVISQVVLGVLSIVLSPTIIPNHFGSFEWMALLHQTVAMLLTMSVWVMIYLTKRNKTVS